jgi:hypothetical protein
MIKTLFTTLLACVFALTALAGSLSSNSGKVPKLPANSSFQLEEAEVYQATQGLTDLETYMRENEGTTLADLEARNSDLLEGMNLDREANVSALSPTEGPAGVPSFFWGLCLGAIGLLIVYIVTEDNDELKKALWGCLAAAGLYILFYVVYFVAIGATWWF